MILFNLLRWNDLFQYLVLSRHKLQNPPICDLTSGFFQNQKKNVLTFKTRTLYVYLQCFRKILLKILLRIRLCFFYIIIPFVVSISFFYACSSSTLSTTLSMDPIIVEETPQEAHETSISTEIYDRSLEVNTEDIKFIEKPQLKAVNKIIWTTSKPITMASRKTTIAKESATATVKITPLRGSSTTKWDLEVSDYQRNFNRLNSTTDFYDDGELILFPITKFQQIFFRHLFAQQVEYQSSFAEKHYKIYWSLCSKKNICMKFRLLQTTRIQQRQMRRFHVSQRRRRPPR